MKLKLIFLIFFMISFSELNAGPEQKKNFIDDATLLILDQKNTPAPEYSAAIKSFFDLVEGSKDLCVYTSMDSETKELRKEQIINPYSELSNVLKNKKIIFPFSAMEGRKLFYVVKDNVLAGYLLAEKIDENKKIFEIVQICASAKKKELSKPVGAALLSHYFESKRACLDDGSCMVRIWPGTELLQSYYQKFRKVDYDILENSRGYFLYGEKWLNKAENLPFCLSNYQSLKTLKNVLKISDDEIFQKISNLENLKSFLRAKQSASGQNENEQISERIDFIKEFPHENDRDFIKTAQKILSGK